MKTLNNFVFGLITLTGITVGALAIVSSIFNDSGEPGSQRLLMAIAGFTASGISYLFIDLENNSEPEPPSFGKTYNRDPELQRLIEKSKGTGWAGDSELWNRVDREAGGDGAGGNV